MSETKIILKTQPSFVNNIRDNNRAVMKFLVDFFVRSSRKKLITMLKSDLAILKILGTSNSPICFNSYHHFITLIVLLAKIYVVFIIEIACALIFRDKYTLKCNEINF